MVLGTATKAGPNVGFDCVQAEPNVCCDHTVSHTDRTSDEDDPVVQMDVAFADKRYPVCSSMANHISNNFSSGETKLQGIHVVTGGDCGYPDK